jgi:hypothetical protein
MTAGLIVVLLSGIVATIAIVGFVRQLCVQRRDIWALLDERTQL